MENSYHCFYASPIGKLYLLADQQSIRQINLLNKTNQPLPSTEDPHCPPLRQILEYLQCYFKGESIDFNQLPLAPVGTPFQRQVWHQLTLIPYGNSCSYGAIAQAINRPTAVRAVGRAVGANPLMIALPCHRVLGAQRKLTGYRGGLVVKIKLLALEGITYLR